MGEVLTNPARVEVAIIDEPVPFDPAEEVEGAGAVIRFHGVVRPNESGKPITGLSYTTYDPMAELELNRLAQSAIDRFDITFVGLTHSRGFVGINRVSLLLVVAAAHRKPALAAMDAILDELKRDVPIWKRPAWSDESEPAQ